MADTLGQIDRYEEAEAVVRDGLAFAGRVGNRYWEWLLRGQVFALYALGEWDELLASLSQLSEEKWAEARQAFGVFVEMAPRVNVHCGALDEAQRIDAASSR